jgi:hypothetical protein
MEEVRAPLSLQLALKSRKPCTNSPASSRNISRHLVKLAAPGLEVPDRHLGVVLNKGFPVKFPRAQAHHGLLLDIHTLLPGDFEDMPSGRMETWREERRSPFRTCLSTLSRSYQVMGSEMD